MHYILIDGNSILYRAFFGIGKMSRSDGLPTNALYGLARKLQEIKDRGPWPEIQPRHFIVVFDHRGGSFREQMYPRYKEDRERHPDFEAQVAHSRILCEALGFPVFEVPGFEADDVLAHMSRLISGRGEWATIVTADKDLLQALGERVAVYDPWTQCAKGDKFCMEKFGVPPEKVAIAQALSGDSSDGFPGVPGIGAKKAAALVNEFGSIGNILSAAKGKKGVMWANIRTVGDELRLFHRLASLDHDTPITIQDILDATTRAVYDKDVADRTLGAYEFNSLIQQST